MFDLSKYVSLYSVQCRRKTTKSEALMLMAHKQCYVTVILNKRRYTSDNAVFDMFTVILLNIFNFFQDHDGTIPLVEATVNEML